MMMMVTWQDSVDMTHKLTAFILAQHKKHKEASKSSGKDGTYYDDDSEWMIVMMMIVIMIVSELSIYLSLWLYVCCDHALIYRYHIYLSIYASIYSSIHLSIYLSNYLSIDECI